MTPLSFIREQLWRFTKPKNSEVSNEVDAVDFDVSNILSISYLAKLVDERTKFLNDFFQDKYGIDTSFFLDDLEINDLDSFQNKSEVFESFLQKEIYWLSFPWYLLYSPKTHKKIKWNIAPEINKAAKEGRSKKIPFSFTSLTPALCQCIDFLVQNDFLSLSRMGLDETVIIWNKVSYDMEQIDLWVLEEMLGSFFDLLKRYVSYKQVSWVEDLKNIHIVIDKLILLSWVLNWLNLIDDDIWSRGRVYMNKYREHLMLMFCKVLDKESWFPIPTKKLNTTTLEQGLIEDIYWVNLGFGTSGFYEKSLFKSEYEEKFTPNKRKFFFPFIFSLWKNVFFDNDIVPFQLLLDYILQTDISVVKENSITRFLNGLSKKSVLAIGDENIVFLIENDLESISYVNNLKQEDFVIMKMWKDSWIDLSILSEINDYESFAKIKTIESEEEFSYAFTSLENYKNYFSIKLIQDNLKADLPYIPFNFAEYDELTNFALYDELYQIHPNIVKGDLLQIYEKSNIQEIIAFNKVLLENRDFTNTNEIITNFYSFFPGLDLEDKKLLLQEIFSCLEEEILFLSSILVDVSDYDSTKLIWNISRLLSKEARESIEPWMWEDYILDWIEHALDFSDTSAATRSLNASLFPSVWTNAIMNIYGEEDADYILDRFKNQNTIRNISKIWRVLWAKTSIFTKWLRKEEKLNPDHIDNIYSLLKFFSGFNITHFDDIDKIFTFVAKSEDMQQRIVYLRIFFKDHDMQDYESFKVSVIRYIKNGDKKVLEQYMNNCDRWALLNKRDNYLASIIREWDATKIEMLAESVTAFISSIETSWFWNSSKTSSTWSLNSKWTGAFINLVSKFYINPLKRNSYETGIEYLQRLSSISFDLHGFDSIDDIRSYPNFKSVYQQWLQAYWDTTFSLFSYVNKLWVFMDDAKNWKSDWVSLSWSDAATVYQEALGRAIITFDRKIKFSL